MPCDISCNGDSKFSAPVQPLASLRIIKDCIHMRRPSISLRSAKNFQVIMSSDNLGCIQIVTMVKGKSIVNSLKMLFLLIQGLMVLSLNEIRFLISFEV